MVFGRLAKQQNQEASDLLDLEEKIDNNIYVTKYPLEILSWAEFPVIPSVNLKYSIV